MTTDSPLALVAPDTLDALFLADPLELTDGQITGLITELRRRRSEFASQEAAKAAKPPRTKAAKGIADAATASLLDKPVGEISLDDL